MADLLAIEPMRGQILSRYVWHLVPQPSSRLRGNPAGAPRSRSTARVPVADGGTDATIAAIAITGLMTKGGSPFGCSSLALADEIRQAANDAGIDGILLVIDSPGGTVAGTAELAAKVADAGKIKPVYGFIEDLCCSGAYWIASQARKVFANDRTAIVGSIGTYLGLYDESRAFHRDGVKPVLITSGAHKGAGFPGTKITGRQRSQLQSVIDATQKSFSDAVRKGRRLSDAELRKVADGRSWLADTAKKLRLIDGIKSLDDVASALAAEAGYRRRRG